jgi:tetratricopeptide (TPR) repeat protein
MNDHATELTAEELMHLAMHAIGQDSPDKAISLLKRLLEMEPQNGKAHYLLGAVHAEIGMYDVAAEEMARAMDLEPDLHTARFQLGLLNLTSGRLEEAQRIWDGLDVLGDRDPLYLFKTGMLHLVKDEFEPCVAALKAGIELNTFNEDLNNDMRRVMSDAQKAMTGHSVVVGEDADNQAAQATIDGRRILLSAYENKDGDA